MTVAPTLLNSRQQSTGLSGANIGTTDIPRGAWMVVVVAHNGTTLTITPPPGWTKMFDENLTYTVPENPYYPARFGTRGFSVYGRLRGVHDDGTTDEADWALASYTFTLSAGNTQRIALTWGEGAMSPANWGMSLVRKRNGTTGEQYLTTAPSVVTTKANSRILAIAVEATSIAEVSATLPTIAGATLVAKYLQGTGATTGVIETIVLGTKVIGEPGASGDVVTTFEVPQVTNAAAVQIVIPPIPDAASVGVPVKLMQAGGLVSRRLHRWNGSKLTTPRLTSVKPGVASVASLMAKSPAIVAHRMGSKNWPEHSMHGATQAAMLGVDAFEFSVARTSDGVWFGLHDASINRTSGTTGLPSASAMTWAEVQAYQSLASLTDDPTQPDRPYLKLTDFLDAYARSHVIFLDPKVLGLSQSVALFQWLKDTYPDALDRFVLKYSYDNSQLADAVGSAGLGFKSWGFLYASNLADAAFTTRASKWTMLGFDYNAQDADWVDFMARAQALGKPVLGHIAPTAVAAQRCLSFGAFGVMVSGVKQVRGAGIGSRNYE